MTDDDDDDDVDGRVDFRQPQIREGREGRKGRPVSHLGPSLLYHHVLNHVLNMDMDSTTWTSSTFNSQRSLHHHHLQSPLLLSRP